MKTLKSVYFLVSFSLKEEILGDVEGARLATRVSKLHPLLSLIC